MVYILYKRATGHTNLYSWYAGPFETAEEPETQARTMNAKANAPVAVVRASYDTSRAPLSIRIMGAESRVEPTHRFATVGEVTR